MHHALNLLRGFLVLTICFHRICGFYFVPTDSLYFVSAFGIASECLWMLSGFVFQMVYSTNLLSGKDSGRDFAVKRFSRLFPLTLVTWVVPMIIVLFTDYVDDFQWYDIFYHLFSLLGFEFANNYYNASQWSFTAGLISSITFCLCTTLLPTKISQSYWFDTIPVAIAIAVRVGFQSYTCRIRTLMGVGFFYGGVLICKATPQLSAYLSTLLSVKARGLIFSLLTLTAFASSCLMMQYIPLSTDDMQTILSFVMAPIIIASTALIPDEVIHPYVQKVCTLSSEISLALFLFHLPVMDQLYRFFPTSFWLSSVMLIPLMVLSWVSYHYAETPVKLWLRSKLLSSNEGSLLSKHII